MCHTACPSIRPRETPELAKILCPDGGVHGWGMEEVFLFGVGEAEPKLPHSPGAAASVKPHESE